MRWSARKLLYWVDGSRIKRQPAATSSSCEHVSEEVHTTCCSHSHKSKPGGTRRPLLLLLAPSAAKPPSLEPRTELEHPSLQSSDRKRLDSICHLQEDKDLACLQIEELTCDAACPGGFHCSNWGRLSSWTSSFWKIRCGSEGTFLGSDVLPVSPFGCRTKRHR